MRILLKEKLDGFILEYLGNKFEFGLSDLKKDKGFKESNVLTLKLSDGVSMSLSRESFLDNLCHHDQNERGHPDDYENEKAIYTIYRLLDGDDIGDIEADIKNIEKQKALLKAKKKEEIDQITAKRVLESLRKERGQREAELVAVHTKLSDAQKSYEIALAADNADEAKVLKNIIASLEKDKSFLKQKVNQYEKEIPEQLKLHQELGEHPTGELSFIVSHEMKKLYVGVNDKKKPHIKLSNVTPAMIKKEYKEAELSLKLL